MIYQSRQMEEQGVLQTAARMCVAARTAPKAKGIDHIRTLVLDGEEKMALADKIEEIGVREFGDAAPGWYLRDAKNVRLAQAVVLIGIKPVYRAIPYCGYCGFANCAACAKAGGRCAISYLDLGVATASAAMLAGADQVDNRIMMSIGKAAIELYPDEGIVWNGIPLSATGKSIFFDRQQ